MDDDRAFAGWDAWWTAGPDEPDVDQREIEPDDDDDPEREEDDA
jgi:hypothetical protein